MADCSSRLLLLTEKLPRKLYSWSLDRDISTIVEEADGRWGLQRRGEAQRRLGVAEGAGGQWRGLRQQGGLGWCWTGSRRGGWQGRPPGLGQQSRSGWGGGGGREGGAARAAHRVQAMQPPSRCWGAVLRCSPNLCNPHTNAF